MPALFIIFALAFSPLSERHPDPMSIYDFTVPSIDGGVIDFSEFRGKKILIVNTASKCGYTKQYAQLEELYKQKKDDMVIIGFPANNFGGQEPGTDSEIAEFCQKNYGVSFPLASKVSVKGDDQHALFTMLTSADNPDFKGAVNWNFEKFLIDEEGKLIRRFRSGADPMGEDILGAL